MTFAKSVHVVAASMMKINMTNVQCAVQQRTVGQWMIHLALADLEALVVSVVVGSVGSVISMISVDVDLVSGFSRSSPSSHFSDLDVLDDFADFD